MRAVSGEVAGVVVLAGPPQEGIECERETIGCPRQNQVARARSKVRHSGPTIRKRRSKQCREREPMSRKNLTMLAALLAAMASPATAQVKIGVLSDMNSLYADITGKGTGVAAHMAAEDFGPVLGKPVEIVTADHQN